MPESAAQQQPKRDNWSSEAYSKAAAFVPALANKVQQYLAPQPGERILDVGCGDGKLTAELAAHVRSGSDSNSGHVVGLDSSPAMIRAAQQTAIEACTFYEHDCARLEPAALQRLSLRPESFDAVFSSAALHWILKSADARKSLFGDLLSVVRPGGRLVFEMGGAGNVAEAHAALRMVLRHRGIPLGQVDSVDPWFFASEAWMEKTLTTAGWNVELVELEYRPTQLTPRTSDGDGGLEGWIQLMGAPFLNLLAESDRAAAVGDVCEAVKQIVEREDGTEVLGYVRLRAIAKRCT